MYFDLHVLWKENIAETQQLLFFLEQLGYNVVALTHMSTGKLPADMTCPIPKILPFPTPSNLRILRRCTFILSDPSQNHRLQLLSKNYDILAIRPTNEKSLQQACQSLDCDIISIDLTTRFEAHWKMKMLAQAVDRGIKFEICYGPGITSGDSNARRNLISNAIQLIRATRGRGLILSSEAHRAVSCRGPADVMNLAAVWGLGPEKGKEALDKKPRSVVIAAQMKHTSYRGIVEVIFGGEKPDVDKGNAQPQAIARRKRKANETEDALEPAPLAGQPNSKRGLKKRQKSSLASAKLLMEAA